MEPPDSSTLPPLFFEPEVDSSGEPSPEASTPPDSTLFPKPTQRNEPKLSLSSYQSVTSGEETLANLMDNDTDHVTPSIDMPDGSDLGTPSIVSKNRESRTNHMTIKTSTPIRNDTSRVNGTSEEKKPRTTSRVSFEKTLIDPSDVRVPVTGFEIMEQRARFTVSMNTSRKENFLS